MSYLSWFVQLPSLAPGRISEMLADCRELQMVTQCHRESLLIIWELINYEIEAKIEKPVFW